MTTGWFAKRKPKVSDFFTQHDLERLKEAVHKAEENTSGEIRVKIILECDGDLASDADIYDDHRVEEQARREFEREGMHSTRDKTGVLVLLVLAEKKFTILADSGIHRKLPQGYLYNLANVLADHFKKGSYASGLFEVVKDIGLQLALFYPRKSDDVNELSDDVSVKE